MKKPLLIITFICISFISAIAQITITSADMPIPTKIIYQANDTLPTVSIGGSGPAQTWDLTSVVQHTIDTSTAMPYSASPNPAFPTATLALQQGTQNFYGYAINSSTSMTILGGGGQGNMGGINATINQINTPAEILFNFPTDYTTNNSFTNDYVADARFYLGQTFQGITIDSIHLKSSVQKSFLVDSWGSLTTLIAGGPYDVLRTKVTKITHDTTQAFFFGGWNDIPGGITMDSVVTYNWWANGFGVPLATATMDSSGNVSTLQWLTALPAEPPLSVSATALDVSCAGSCNGTATATGTWGSGPYTYSWNTSPAQDSVTAIDLCVGTYIVTITDSLMATSTATVVIANPPHPVITANGTILNTNITATGFQWYLNGVVIPNATSSSYTVTQNGNYTISASTGGGCTDTSAIYNFNTIGINESILNNSFSVYPNPASSQITIKFDASVSNLLTPSKQDVLIDIKNELGQSIKHANVMQLVNGKNEMTMNIADLPKGIYFINIKNQDTTINKKFIKQ